MKTNEYINFYFNGSKTKLLSENWFSLLAINLDRDAVLNQLLRRQKPLLFKLIIIACLWCYIKAKSN